MKLSLKSGRTIRSVYGAYSGRIRLYFKDITVHIRHAPNSNCSSRFDPNSSSSSSRLSSSSNIRVRVQVRVRVRDLQFGFGFEFENYPINLVGIECLSGSPSFFPAIRNQLWRHSKFDWVRVRVFPNIVNFNFNAFNPSVYGVFILFFAYLP